MDKSLLYDRLYALAGKVLDKHKPCESCGRCTYFGGSVSGCCRGCPFLKETGCSIQSLGCKLWLCHDERLIPWKLHPRVRHQLKRLERIADKHGINFARAAKEEVLSVADITLETLGFDRKWYFYYMKNRGS